MKKTFLILILIIIFSCKTTINFSKDTAVIKKLDTIYVLFEEGKNQYKSKYNKYNKGHPEEKNGIKYYFKFDKKYVKYISFYHEKYRDWDAMIAKDSSKILTKNKKFLKNNVIINYSYFIENEFCRAISSFKTIKFFIIDKAEFTNKKITLRQVYFFSSCERCEPEE